ncbi:hypothetical protein BN1058_01472 [Paraliobacillus sp. PM-2]|uniref:DUF2399 domain-containing protein n=1 Tax=Paraliobacillus sp. PM-2 TaxID=1462524 RepID=UPI00061BF1D6|nr:DUF2399 domain-containing protein [Paraliobacillus sp. PM-2]CQR47181.1 hypothetical protein BN1058_01472 [Paraliobacillus sp. PM-2]
MVSEALHYYLQHHIALKNESIHVNDAYEQNDIIHIPIIKRTTRTRKIVARLMVGKATDPDLHHIDTIPTKLTNGFNSPKTKKQIDLSDETYEWIRYGWIIREIRLEKDERTVKTERYRMGFVLYQLSLKIQAEAAKETRNWILDWKKCWDVAKHSTILRIKQDQRADVVSLLAIQLDKIASETDKVLTGETKLIERIHPTWRLRKQVVFLHFLIALYQLACTEKYFDWKQIGATYYRTIGGSKKFDAYKKDFIEETEKQLHRPIQLLGLASMGTITPLFFTGPMKGNHVEYSYGTVHATTDLAVFLEKFTTKADVLWLVENRGVLTRVAYEEKFLRDTKSFVLGVDGQVRSAHRQLISQLTTCVSQVIIWTDVDEAGYTIAEQLYELIQDEQVLIKWIVPPLTVETEWGTFASKYQQSIQRSKEEQEQEIGGVELWKKWINH